MVLFIPGYIMKYGLPVKNKHEQGHTMGKGTLQLVPHSANGPGISARNLNVQFVGVHGHYLISLDWFKGKS